MYRDDHWNENRKSPHERSYVDEDLIDCVGDPHEIQNHREYHNCARREREEQRHDYLCRNPQNVIVQDQNLIQFST